MSRVCGCGAKALALIVCVLAVPSTAAAQTPPVDAYTRAFLTVIVNERASGESIVLIRPDGTDVLLPQSVIDRLGLKLTSSASVQAEDRLFISLKSTNPRVEFTLDDVGLELRLQVSPRAFPQQSIDLRAREPEGTRHTHDASMFVNYGINWTRTSSPTLNSEVGASVGTALFVTSFYQSSAGQPHRGLSTLTIDQPSALRRYSGGDFATQSGTLWSAGLLTGVGVSREFALDPYFVSFPTPRLSETLATPSTVDVYVDDRLVSRSEMAPGVFDVTGIPALAGAGNTRVVVRDGLGRSREISTSYYVTSSVLGRGLHDYQYAIGQRTRSVGAERVRDIAASMTHRVGLIDAITAGVHVEGDRTLQSGGPSVTARVGRFGELEMAFGVSRAPGLPTGRATSLAWAFLARPFNLSVSVKSASAGFVTFGEPESSPASRLDWSGMLSFALPLVGTVQWRAHQQWIDRSLDSAEPWRRQLQVGGNRRLAGNLQLQWRASRTWTPTRRSVEASLGIAVGFGRNMASVSATSDAGDVRTEAYVSRPLATGSSAGYRLRLDDSYTNVDSSLQAQNSLGRYEVELARIGGAKTTYGVRASGALVVIGKSIVFAPPLGESYALVRVPGVRGVRVFSNNVEVGRTDRFGRLLVPRLIANYANRLSISDIDLKADHTVADPEKLVAPPARAGAVVVFDQERLQAVTGTLLWIDLDGRSRVPAFGLLTVNVGVRVVESPITAEGEFFLEQVHPGVYPGTIQYRNEVCTVALAVPEHAGPLINLGTLTCRRR